jgi:hypothetical protein
VVAASPDSICGHPLREVEQVGNSIWRGLSSPTLASRGGSGREPFWLT